MTQRRPYRRISLRGSGGRFGMIGVRRKTLFVLASALALSAMLASLALAAAGDLIPPSAGRAR
jgi:hypothetical protein